MKHKVELRVNGRVIALNPFVQKIFVNLILAAVQSLDKIPQPAETIEIVLKREND